jgi:ribulose-phosphate 3-epimerase
LKVAVSFHASDDFNVNVLKSLKGLDLIHLDIMDGKFVPNLKNNLDVLRKIKSQSDIPIEVHLMVEDPINYIDKIVDYIDIFLFHIEIKQNIQEIILKVKSLNKKVGLVINPDTKIEDLEKFLPIIDTILLLGVKPGFSGQKFIESTNDRLKDILKFKEKFPLEIRVDGGVNLETSKKLLEADVLISASAILNAKNPNKVIKELKKVDN